MSDICCILMLSFHPAPSSSTHLLVFSSLYLPFRDVFQFLNILELMNRPIRIQHPLLKIVNNALIDLPSPSNIRT